MGLWRGEILVRWVGLSLGRAFRLPSMLRGPTLSMAHGVGMVLLGAAVVFAQEGPADPLELLKQQERERAENATQSSEIAAGLQRQLLGEMHGTNGAGKRAREAAGLAEQLTEEQVRAAMGRGAEYLLKRLEKEGTFTGIPAGEQRPWVGFAGDQQVGVAGLAVYALLEAGKATGDPKLRAGSAEMRPLVNYLMKARTRQTYSAALQACALASLPQNKDVRAV